MNKKSTLSIILIIMLVLLVSVASSFYDAYKQQQDEEDIISGTLVEKENAGDEANHLRDKDLLYTDNYTDVETMYLTVSYGNSSENTDHTWEEVNTYSAYYYDNLGIDRYKVAALLQVGDESGPVYGKLGYGRNTPNATVQVRGQTSSTNVQKNYKIKLKDNVGTWNGQSTIALNKHQTDYLRFRNKLCFDLMSEIDEIMSLRTSFVHLYVKDTTAGSDVFEDYGLYTQVEQLNKAALKNHGLDKNGYLYKVNFFEFYRYEDAIMLETDPDYDLSAFNEYLEVKGDSDHKKLIKMLEDVNDYSLDIEDILEEHFDTENIAYWMAFNILIGNYDTQSRNMYLYSPSNIDTWYILPWDYDDAFMKDENQLLNNNDGQEWEVGVSNYWGNVLFQRCLKSEEFRNELDSAITDIKENVLTSENISEKVEQYETVTRKYVYEYPDITNEALSSEEYDTIASGLPLLVDEYYDLYKESLQKPMPFYIGIPNKTDEGYVLNWDISYDFQQQDILYDMTLAKDPEMTEIIESYTGIWPTYTFSILEPGNYYIKVTATDSDGNVQTAFDYYPVENGKIYGVKAIVVNDDGSISEVEVEE